MCQSVSRAVDGGVVQVTRLEENFENGKLKKKNRCRQNVTNCDIHEKPVNVTTYNVQFVTISKNHLLNDETLNNLLIVTI